MKTNPRRIPRTQQDVDRAYDRGLVDGTTGALIIMLYVMHDKFGASDEELKEFSDAFNYTSDSMARGYITRADLQTVVKEEYGTILKTE